MIKKSETCIYLHGRTWHQFIGLFAHFAKKLHLIVVFLLSCGLAVGQKAIPDNSAKVGGGGNSNSILFETLVGSTNFDIQGASDGKRIYNLAGTINIAFNYSDIDTTLSPVYTRDNFYDGFNWIGGAGANVDSIMYSTIDAANGTEYLIGQYRYPSANSLVLCKRSPAGAGSWNKTLLPAHPAGHPCLWAKLKVGGVNNQTLHVVAMTLPVSMGGSPLNGVDGVITYSRSQNGGLTWDLIHVGLPMTTSAQYAGMMPASYAIDAIDNVVAITQGSYFNDWVLWKSTDNGGTWTRKVMQHFPIPAYNPSTMDTDVDGNGIGDYLTSMDGYQSVLIDNTGMVHCWAGAMNVVQHPSQSFTLSFDNHEIIYWNESMNVFPPVAIAEPEDIDGSGQIEIIPNYNGYGVSVAGMPSSAIDAAGNIYLAFSMMVEWTTNGNPNPAEEESFRNVYMIRSTDQGASWTLPVRIEPSDFDEMVFPSLARKVNDQAHLIYQKDAEPGTWVLGNDVPGITEMIYAGVDTSSSFFGPPAVFVNPTRIEGTVFIDANQNGVKDAGEFGMMGYSVRRMPGNQFVSTNQQGQFVMNAPPGNYTVSVLPGPNWNVTNNPATYNVTLNSSVVTGVNFGLFPAGQNNDIYIDITSSIPRCNNTITYWITYINTGTTTLSGDIRFVIDGLLTYNTANPAPVNIIGDTLIWNFSNLMPAQSGMLVVTTTSFGIFMGTTISNCSEATFSSGGPTGSVSKCLNSVIVCSYDPNDKMVSPPGVGNENYVLFADTLIYTVRFQNTGNDTAFNVVVLDTLHAMLNPATFRFISSSHPVTVETFPGNVYRFRYDNIMLPDSNVNEPGSNGFFKYSVLPYQNAPIGTPITNTAYIYFDYNPAIITNTTLSTVVDVIGINESLSEPQVIKVFPNPASQYVDISLEDLTDVESLSLFDLFGRELERVPAARHKLIRIDLHNCDNGLYFLTAFTGNGTRSVPVKLVISR